MATLVGIHEANHSRVILTTILIEDNLKEEEEIVRSIGKATNPWFTLVFNFLKYRDLLEDQKLEKEI